MVRFKVPVYALVAATICIVVIGCALQEPDLEEPTTESSTVTAAPTEADKACPDNDNDSFSRNPACSLPDCNDDDDYIDIDGQGYCDTYPYLIYDAWDDCNCTISDFTLIDDGGLVHLFYTTGWQIEPGVAQDFGHSTTTDGLTWTVQDPVIGTVPGSDWEDKWIWAPSVLRNHENGYYYMFYTGVTDGDPIYHHEERIGLAVSQDLSTWIRMPVSMCTDIAGEGCIWEGDTSWSAWNTDQYWARQCRDPYVFWDKTVETWYMVYSTTIGDPLQMVIGLARSHDLARWVDCGPILCTQGSKAESAHVYKVNGEFYLFWTYHTDGGIKYSRSSVIEGDLWGSPTLMQDSQSGFRIASEAVKINNWPVFAYVREFTRDFRFYALTFQPDGSPITEDLPLFTCEYLGAENVYPGAPEIANGIDDNCDRRIDEVDVPCIDEDGDGFGNAAGQSCTRFGVDCDDSDPEIYPGATGSCNDGRDNNCDGLVDNNVECGSFIRIRPMHY